jgi:maleylacetate reductase
MAQADRSFVHPNPSVRVVVGPGSLAQAAEEMDRLGAERALVLCGRTISQKTPVLDNLRSILGHRLAGVFTGVVERSPREVLQPAVEMARHLRADLLISIGGGSAVGAARSVALMLAGGALEAPKVPILAVPTTLSAAEANAGYVRVGERTELDFALRPPVVILDPEVAAYTPDVLFASTGFNALNHCIEGLISVLHQPFADAYYLHAARLIVENLPAAIEDREDLTARGRALMGGYMSGMMLPITWLGIAHALCHGLGRVARTPHGLNNAVMVTHGMRYNLEVAAERIAYAAPALGVLPGASVRETALRCIGAIEALRRRLGLPEWLRDLGIARESLPEVAEHALHDFFTPYNPRKPRDAAELLAILEEAW